MNTSKLLIAAACSLTVIGASSVAVAQTTSPNTSNTGAANPNQYQNQNQAPSSDRTSTTGSSTSGNTDSTTQRQSESGTGTTGSRMGRTTDDSMRNNADGSTMRSERLARADRN